MERLTVVWDFVAGFVDSEEVQVTNTLELTSRDTIDSVLGKFGGLELSRVGVFEVVHNKLASVPVANPVYKKKTVRIVTG